MFSVEATYNMRDVEAYIEKRMQERIGEIVEFLSGKGVEYTKIAREKTLANRKYNNRTFNLVSSVGFAIVKSGQLIESYFPLLETGTEGKAKGEETAERYAKKNAGNDEIVLVLVAGEDYASYVQEINDFDVTDMASKALAKLLRKEWGKNQ